MSKEERDAIVKAKIAERNAKKTKDSLPPVERKPYDPENMFLSKEEFRAKRMREEEEKAQANAFIAQKRGKKDVQEEEKEKVLEPKKLGRPKKVE